jgi:hypothetical protein
MPQINQFTNEASAIAEADYLGFEQDVGGGSYRPAKSKRARPSRSFWPT